MPQKDRTPQLHQSFYDNILPAGAGGANGESVFIIPSPSGLWMLLALDSLAKEEKGQI